MSTTTDLRATLDALRLQLEADGSIPAALPMWTAADPEVQIVVRLPEGLREAVRVTAARHGVSGQSWLHGVIEDAVVAANDPAAAFVAGLATQLRADLAAGFRAGYSTAAAEVDDEIAEWDPTP